MGKGEASKMIIDIKGYKVLIDDFLAPIIEARKWHIGDRKRGIYFATSIRFSDGQWHDVKLHRFIKEAPPNMLVDHRNGNHLDCRLENLRVCTTAQNTQNTPILKTNKTGFRGVSCSVKTGKYVAAITQNKRRFHLGYFETAEEAAEVFNKKAKELFGEYYRDAEAEKCG
jgi:hypothetical protein